MTRMRKAIARRLQQSKQTIPHFYVTVTVDMTDAIQRRKEHHTKGEDDINVSINDMVVMAAATPTITVAAFGPKAVDVARGADRMVLNMVTTNTAQRLAAQHPNTAVWLCAAIDPSDEERDWLARGFVGYLAAPGYAEMFVEAGFGELVDFVTERVRAASNGQQTQ